MTRDVCFAQRDGFMPSITVCIDLIPKIKELLFCCVLFAFCVWQKQQFEKNDRQSIKWVVIYKTSLWPGNDPISKQSLDLT